MQQIHFAAFHDSLECVAFYLDHGWDVNKPTTQGFTPLHFACAIGAEETAVFLLERGANPNPNPDGVSPLYCAAYRGSELIVGALFHFGATVKSRAACDPADLALRRRHFGCLLLFLERSQLSASGTGYSPLMRAIAMRMSDAIEPLLDLGCPADGAQVPALYLACMQRDLSVIRLIASRIKQEQIGPGRTAPLHWACLAGSLEVVKFIYAEVDQNVNARDANLHGPMFYALSAQPQEEMHRIVAFLIAHGADVDEQAPPGKSGILGAAVMALASLKTVQLIAERVHSARVCRKVLKIARAVRSDDVIRLLEHMALRDSPDSRSG